MLVAGAFQPELAAELVAQAVRLPLLACEVGPDSRCQGVAKLVGYTMTEPREKDAMICRACGNEERASEGYPCSACGTFICVICSFRGVVRCRKCSGGSKLPEPSPTPVYDIPLMDWPEH